MLIRLLLLLTLSACGGGDDCEAGKPLMGGLNPDCVEKPAPAASAPDSAASGAP